MFTHDQIWSAIDALAQQKDMSVSRLARNAGLDPTTFNKSKRTAGDGRQRWPSTESLSKIMEATGTSVEDLLALINGEEDGFNARYSIQSGGGFSENTGSHLLRSNSVPLLGLAQAGAGGFFDDAGLPLSEGWDAVDFPLSEGDSVYALEISGDSMMPLYRDGDRIIVSPTSSIRRGDRVVVRTHDGEVMAKILARQTSTLVELESLNPAHKNRTLELVNVDWIARIVWASQ